MADDELGESKEPENEDEDEKEEEENEPPQQQQLKPKKKKKKKDGPLSGRRVKSVDTNAKTGKEYINAIGTIIQVIKRKNKTKKYDIEWDNSKKYANVTFGYVKIKTMLIPP